MGMEEAASRNDSDPAPADGGIPFPIVGIGSATGGLEPLKSLLRAMTPEQDKALVIVQHLSPGCASALAEILLDTAKGAPPPDEAGQTAPAPDRDERDAELARLRHDLRNLLENTQTAILIVSREMRLRRFTPVAGRMLHLGEEDLDRPLQESRLGLALPDLEPLLLEVMDTASPRDGEVEDAEGRRFSLRARPYRTHENEVDGVVVTLEDLDAQRRAGDHAQSLVANARGPLLVLDGTMRVRSASQAFYDFFGMAAAETEGRHLHEIGEREWDIPALRTLLEEVLTLEQVVKDYELTHSSAKLGARALLLNVHRLAQAPDLEPLLLLSLDDITQRKQTETALKESEERLRLSQEVAHIGNFDWDLETGVKVWSKELELLYGLPPGGFPQTREAWESLLHPEDREGALAAVDRALETGELVEAEWRVIWPDGSEHWLASRFQAYSDAAGRPVRIVGVNLDITCRKWNEEALRASEAIKSAILDSALDAIFTLDHQGRLVGFNPAAERIFGYTREEVLGRPMAEVLLPERLHEQNRRGFAHFLATGEGPVLDRLPALRADGTEFPAEMTIVAVPGSDPPLFTGFLRDVTERKQMEDSLRERADALARADRNKDEFLAMLAHELRNPLAPLRNAAEILAADQTTVEENAHARRVIVRQIENMSRMLDDLLDVSRLTKGRIDLRTKSVSLGAILTAATSQVRAGCTTRGQQVSLTLPSQPVHLEGDATRLEQVFVNLLGNAAKYSGEGSRIEVIAEREAPDPTSDPSMSHVRVTVRDNGAGIAPELLPHVFDLFVQASRTLDRQHGGLGIGLTLVRRLVALHGGTVEANSEGLGKGSEFVVRLPILTVAPAPPHHLPPAVEGETPRRILIVDDNEDSANSLAVLHSHRGHDTRTAYTGPDGVTAAAEFLPEVILLDIGLPWMDGFEVARRIRALPGMEDALLIAMSGYGRKEDRDAAAEAGFNHYLVKPMDLDRLRQLLQEHFTASQ